MRGRRRGSADQDRSARHDWWGVVVDSPDPQASARFYSELLGWPLWRAEESGESGGSEDGEAALDLGEGVGYLAFHRKADYVRPVWPNTPGEQQMMMHLDFEVSDLAEATRHALELGAELAAHQPQADVRVFCDPDGHPFCLYLDPTARPDPRSGA